MTTINFPKSKVKTIVNTTLTAENTTSNKQLVIKLILGCFLVASLVMYSTFKTGKGGSCVDQMKHSNRIETRASIAEINPIPVNEVQIVNITIVNLQNFVPTHQPIPLQPDKAQEPAMGQVPCICALCVSDCDCHRCNIIP